MLIHFIMLNKKAKNEGTKETGTKETGSKETGTKDTRIKVPKMIKHLEKYIGSLIENVDSKKIPKTMNVIFDGGCMNGFYAIGIGMYINELKKNGLKINKVSGCSAGAIVAVNFLVGNFNNWETPFKQMIESFRNRQNASAWLDIIRDNIFLLFDNDTTSLDKIQDKLYISYYDISKHKQCVIHKYASREELVEYIIRSSFVPYIVNGNKYYKKTYIDGITPYIFNDSDEHPSLFVQLVGGKRIARALMTKNEVNLHHRILSGLADANDFFTTGSSAMCSYVNNWTTIDKLLFHARPLFFFTIFTILEVLITCRKSVPDFIHNNLLCQSIERFIKEIYKEIVRSFFI